MFLDTTDYGLQYVGDLRTLRLVRWHDEADGRFSRGPVELHCPDPKCRRQPRISREHWDELIQLARRVAATWIDLSRLD